MQDSTFEKLAADAAAGLQADQEVYRDITQELYGFLEDKADRFRREIIGGARRSKIKYSEIPNRCINIFDRYVYKMQPSANRMASNTQRNRIPDLRLDCRT